MPSAHSPTISLSHSHSNTGIKLNNPFKLGTSSVAFPPDAHTHYLYPGSLGSLDGTSFLCYIKLTSLIISSLSVILRYSRDLRFVISNES